MPKEYLSWDEYEKIVEELANKIPNDIKFIYGIKRGGLIPATMLAYMLDVHMVTEISVEMNINSLLIVDDIVDTGGTMQCFIDQCQTASVFVNSNKCKNYPTYFGKETQNWIVFPYERDKDTISTMNSTS